MPKTLTTSLTYILVLMMPLLQVLMLNLMIKTLSLLDANKIFMLTMLKIMVAFLFPNPKLKDHAQSLSMISFSMLLKGQANGKKSKQAFNYKTTMEMSNVLAHLKNDHLLTSIFYLILKMVRFI